MESLRARVTKPGAGWAQKGGEAFPPLCPALLHFPVRRGSLYLLNLYDFFQVKPHPAILPCFARAVGAGNRYPLCFQFLAESVIGIAPIVLNVRRPVDSKDIVLCKVPYFVRVEL